MNLGCFAVIAILALPAAEILLFVAVAEAIGLPVALGLLAMTSLAGAVILATAGRRARAQFRAAGAGLTVTQISLRTSGALAVLGGILLLVPGFITDLLGIWALLAALRRWLSVHDGRRGAPHAAAEQIVDLERSQWRRVPEPATDTKPDEGQNP
jgi:UPF0716 protein FxsA